VSTEAPVARVNVRILEKEYQFSCAADERPALLDSAEFLNNEMRKIRDSCKVIGLERIAVMAALNMANELLRGRARGTNLEGDVVQRVRLLRERVESTLERSLQLEL